MKGRRQFVKTALAMLAGVGVLDGPFFPFLRSPRAEEPRIILPKGTKREDLAHRNPANLDTRNLDITPLKDFQTMGTTEYNVNVEKWRLAVSGRIRNPLTLTYTQIQAMPLTERRVLLICPGFFANYGRWKGIRVKDLFEKVEAEKKLTEVTFISQEGTYERTQKFSIDEILTEKVFLAYGVNGESLPPQHGFPLRVVAEGHYGSSWAKYVSRVIAE